MSIIPQTGGGIAHAVIRVLFIIANLVALGIAAKAISAAHRGVPGVVIAGSVIATATDILSIFAYNRRSHAYPFTMVGDAFAAIAFGVGFSLLAHIVIHDVVNEDNSDDDYYYVDYGDYVMSQAAVASFSLAMIRVASFIGTGVLGCVMARRWDKQDYGRRNNV
ncbi:hypothetical protein SEUCBS139899_009449 [Sporothrix eucalyptigena]|uniref:MARVEL domain-containing protein n=1 Tax=Sporothrix eucalyptigena TaxID=1812306 RepID=A0ABP0CVR6_9PEZI